MKTVYAALLGMTLVLGKARAEDSGWVCPKDTKPSIYRQGNTAVYSCRDAEGKPHGPFAVRGLPDSLGAGKGTDWVARAVRYPFATERVLVEGQFEHGRRVGEWVSYSDKGKRLEAGDFLENRKVTPAEDIGESAGKAETGGEP